MQVRIAVVLLLACVGLLAMLVNRERNDTPIVREGFSNPLVLSGVPADLTERQLDDLVANPIPPAQGLTALDDYVDGHSKPHAVDVTREDINTLVAEDDSITDATETSGGGAAADALDTKAATMRNKAERAAAATKEAAADSNHKMEQAAQDSYSAKLASQKANSTGDATAVAKARHLQDDAAAEVQSAKAAAQTAKNRSRTSHQLAGAAASAESAAAALSPAFQSLETEVKQLKGKLNQANKASTALKDELGRKDVTVSKLRAELDSNKAKGDDSAGQEQGDTHAEQEVQKYRSEASSYKKKMQVAQGALEKIVDTIGEHAGAVN